MLEIETDYSAPIEVGTSEDDGRVSPTALLLRMHDNDGRVVLRVLSQPQALRLAAAIIETVQGLPSE